MDVVTGKFMASSGMENGTLGSTTLEISLSAGFTPLLGFPLHMQNIPTYVDVSIDAKKDLR